VFLKNGLRIAMWNTLDCYDSFEHLRKRLHSISNSPIELFSHVILRLTAKNSANRAYPSINTIDDFYSNLESLSMDEISRKLSNSNKTCECLLDDIKLNLKGTNRR
jgi:hypothetical protein